MQCLVCTQGHSHTQKCKTLLPPFQILVLCILDVFFEYKNSEKLVQMQGGLGMSSVLLRDSPAFSTLRSGRIEPLCSHCVLDSLQAQLINMDIIPTLVKLLGIHSHNTALTEMCLIAFGNLAELGE